MTMLASADRDSPVIYSLYVDVAEKVMKASTLTKIAEDPVENEASKKSIRWAPQVGNRGAEKRKRARVIFLDKRRPPSQGGTLSKGKQLSASKKSTSENAKKKFKVQKEYKNIHSTKPPRNTVQKEGTSNAEAKRNVAEMKSQDQKMTGQSPVQKKVKEDSFSPTSNSVFKRTSVSQNKVLDKDGKTAGLTKWKNISKLPEISPFQKRRSLGDMCPPSPEEDVLALPFGGARKISDSSLLTVNKATNVIYTINQARKKRLKESFNAQIAAVHDRVRRVGGHDR